MDLDYGNYRNDSKRYQPNRYYDATEEILLTEIINSFDTPTDIDIYTFQADYEDELWGGTTGRRHKLSQVISDNTFLFYDELNGNPRATTRNSNRFKYDEKVYAGYLNYARDLRKKMEVFRRASRRTNRCHRRPPSLSARIAGAAGAAQLPELVSQRRTHLEPPKHVLALNGGRRINRPDYNVLNPFNNQISQLSYEKGNPFLRPKS